MPHFVKIPSTFRSPLLPAIDPSLPLKNIKDLIALAKAQPSALSYSHGAQDAFSHLAGELFKSMGGVRIVNIPCRSE